MIPNVLAPNKLINLKLPVDVKSVVMALFLSAGVLKSNDVIRIVPIDLTLLMGIILVITVVVNLARQGTKETRTFIAIFVLFFLFLIPVLWTASTLYANEKVIRLFTLTLASAIAPLVLFRTETDLRRFLNAMLGVSLLLITDGLFGLWTQPDQHLERLIDEVATSDITAPTSIALSIYAAFGSLWIVLVSLEAGHWRKYLVLLQIPIVITMIASGSRGPLIAFAVAMVLIILIYRVRAKKALINLVMVSIFVVLIIYIALYNDLPFALPLRSVQRITDLYYEGAVEETRLSYLSVALDYILSSPQGIGWGGFGIIYGETGRFFVHNLVIEIFLEAGWPAGLFFIWLLLTALRRVISLAIHTRRTEVVGIAAILVFLIIESQISGEINDSRWIFTFLSLALSAKAFAVKPSSQLRRQP